MYDSLNMHSLESSLIDIMRAEQDPMKSKASSFLLCVYRRGGGGEGERRGRGWGEVIMFAEEAHAVQGMEVTGPAAPRAVLIFHTAAYFLHCLQLHTFCHQLHILREHPAPDPAAAAAWPEQQAELVAVGGGGATHTMVLLTSLLSSASLHRRCEQ